MLDLFGKFYLFFFFCFFFFCLFVVLYVSAKLNIWHQSFSFVKILIDYGKDMSVSDIFCKKAVNLHELIFKSSNIHVRRIKSVQITVLFHKI